SQHAHHLLVNQSVAREDRRVVNIEGLALEVGNSSARFFHNQSSGSNIPGLQSNFPETVKPTTRYVRKIERRRSIASHTLTLNDKLRHEASRLDATLNIIRKAGADHCVIETPNS